jgi:hypothetical protein
MKRRPPISKPSKKQNNYTKKKIIHGYDLVENRGRSMLRPYNHSTANCHIELSEKPFLCLQGSSEQKAHTKISL